MAKKKRGSPKPSFFAFQDIITSVSGILIIITLMLVTMIEPAGNEAPTEEVPNQLGMEDLDARRQAADKKNRELEERRQAFLGKAPEQIESEIEGLEESLVKTEEQLQALREKARDLDQAADEQNKLLGLDTVETQVETAQREVSQLESEKNEIQGIVDRLNGEKEAEANALGEAKETVFVVAGKSNQTPIVCVVGGSETSVVNLGQPGQSTSIPSNDLANGFQAALARYDPQQNYFFFLVRPSGIAKFKELSDLARQARYSVGYDPLGESTALNFGPGK